MSNALEDKLNNDYSTEYVLIVDESPYYINGNDIAYTSEYYDKINNSSTSGETLESGKLLRSKLDPFRQATGKFWTYTGKYDSFDGMDVPGYTKFYNTYANDANDTLTSIIDAVEGVQGKIPIANEYITQHNLKEYIKVENVTSLWREIWKEPEYPIIFTAMKRKATRLKFVTKDDDLLDNRLMMLSLFSDINIKNSGISIEQPIFLTEAYQKLDEEYNILLDELNQLLQDLKALEDLLNSLIEEYNSTFDPATLEAIYNLDSFPESFSGQEEGAEGEGLIPDKKAEIEEKETQIQKKSAEINEKIQFYIGAEAKFDFPPVGNGNDYNYNSCFTRLNIKLINPNLIEYGKTNIADLQGQWSLFKETAENNWASYTYEAFKNIVYSSKLNSLYNFETNTYSGLTAGAEERSEPEYFYDSAFAMPLPMTPEAQTLVGEQDKSSLYVDVKPVYNYYSKYYELATEKFILESPTETPDLVLTETYLPLIYDIPLEETMDSEGNVVVSADPIIDKITIGEPPSKFLFEKFGNTILNCDVSAPWFIETYAKDNYFNIVIDQTNKQYLAKFDSVKGQFPFYINLEVKVDENKKFATLFNQTGATNFLINALIKNFFLPSKQGTQVFDPSKDQPIGEEEGDDSYTYYDSLDLNLEYGGEPKDDSAPICIRDVYKILPKRQFYKVSPPATTADAELIGDLGFNNTYEAKEQYNVREFDLTKFLHDVTRHIMEPYLTEGSPLNLSNEEKSLIIEMSSYASPAPKKTIKAPPAPGESISYSTLQFFDTNHLNLITGYGQMSEELMRNYHQILDKTNLAYNETLFYRIQKVAVDENGNVDEGGWVQNIWMVKPDDDTGSDIMNYIDTQVRYGQGYEYTVYAYQIVVGTKYGFQFENSIPLADNSTPESSIDSLNKLQLCHNSVITSANPEAVSCDIDSPIFISDKVIKIDSGADTAQIPIGNSFYRKPGNSNRVALVDVICEPDVKMVEVPMYKKVVTVADAPPMYPEVDIVPLNGKQNDIKINFYPGSVSSEMIPLEIDIQDDAPKILKIRKSQDRNLLKQQYASLVNDTETTTLPPSYYVFPKLKFKSDDFVTHYEIYRLEEPPINYTSFKDNLLSTINQKDQSSYTDSIEQNKKYYYTFRSIDIHENISNPSPVYQVEMVENSGVTYPVISIYDFDQPQKNVKSKQFKRYLKIDASQLQGVLNLEQSDLQDSDSAADAKNKPIVLGTKTDKLFNTIDLDGVTSGSKKFKFRIKSKHTGKIVDLNIMFKARGIGINEDVPSCGDDDYVEYNLPEAGSDTEHEGAGSDGGGNNEGHSW